MSAALGMDLAGPTLPGLIRVCLGQLSSLEGGVFTPSSVAASHAALLPLPALLHLFSWSLAKPGAWSCSRGPQRAGGLHSVPCPCSTVVMVNPQQGGGNTAWETELQFTRTLLAANRSNLRTEGSFLSKRFSGTSLPHVRSSPGSSLT